MAYMDVEEAIAGVLRASGVPGIDWSRSPYYIEAADPLPGAADSVYSDAPFPYVAYMLPESSTQHNFELPYIETYHPTFFVVGTQKHRRTTLAPYSQTKDANDNFVGIVPFLDSLRQSTSNADGPNLFNGDGFGCIQFTRDGLALTLDPNLGPKGQRVWVMQATYTMIFNAG